MRVLSFDPGAERMGHAVLESGPKFIVSGVRYCNRWPKEAFQAYRLRLEQLWVEETIALLDDYGPDAIVSEIVPSTGFNNASQSYLANTAITVVHAIAYSRGIPVHQLSARHVQKQIAIRGKSKKITKPQVRNGVIQLLPELKPKLSKWVKIFEEPDALAVGLTYLGYSNPN